MYDCVSYNAYILKKIPTHNYNYMINGFFIQLNNIVAGTKIELYLSDFKVSVITGAHTRQDITIAVFPSPGTSPYHSL